VNNKAVYAGSFDPVTYGHLWVIEKSANMYDQVIIAIGNNPDKRYMFSIHERMTMLQDTTKHLDNVIVEAFSDEFLVNYAKRKQANFLIRGIRNNIDYEYERTMRYINSDLNPDITSIFLMPPRKYAEISSSLIKGLIQFNEWETALKKYLPEASFNSLTNYIAHKNNNDK